MVTGQETRENILNLDINTIKVLIEDTDVNMNQAELDKLKKVLETSEPEDFYNLIRNSNGNDIDVNTSFNNETPFTDGVRKFLLKSFKEMGLKFNKTDNNTIKISGGAPSSSEPWKNALRAGVDRIYEALDITQGNLPGQAIAPAAQPVQTPVINQPVQNTVTTVYQGLTNDQLSIITAVIKSYHTGAGLDTLITDAGLKPMAEKALSIYSSNDAPQGLNDELDKAAAEFRVMRRLFNLTNGHGDFGSLLNFLTGGEALKPGEKSSYEKLIEDECKELNADKVKERVSGVNGTILLYTMGLSVFKDKDPTIDLGDEEVNNALRVMHYSIFDFVKGEVKKIKDKPKDEITLEDCEKLGKSFYSVLQNVLEEKGLHRYIKEIKNNEGKVIKNEPTLEDKTESEFTFWFGESYRRKIPNNVDSGLKEFNNKTEMLKSESFRKAIAMIAIDELSQLPLLFGFSDDESAALGKELSELITNYVFENKNEGITEFCKSYNDAVKKANESLKETVGVQVSEINADELEKKVVYIKDSLYQTIDEKLKQIKLAECPAMYLYKLEKQDKKEGERKEQYLEVWDNIKIFEKKVMLKHRENDILSKVILDDIRASDKDNFGKNGFYTNSEENECMELLKKEVKRIMEKK